MQAGGLAVCSLCKVHNCWFGVCLSASRWSCSVLWVSVNSDVFVQAVGLAGYLSVHVFQVSANSWRLVMSFGVQVVGLVGSFHQ